MVTPIAASGPPWRRFTAHHATGTNTVHALRSRAHMHHAVSPAARSASPIVSPSASNTYQAAESASIDAPTVTSCAEAAPDANACMMSPGSSR